MVWTVQLDDSTDTVNLNDRVNFYVNVGGFQAPPPPKRTSYSGGNLARHGADLVESAYDNRRITVDCQIVSTGTAGSLGTYARNIWGLLRKAEDNAKYGLGTAVYLRYGWESGSGTISFRILEGVLDLGAGLHSAALTQGTRIANARLELICEPFAYGTAESVSNYLADPSFEVAGSPLADWTQTTLIAGTTERTTTTAYYGTASLRMTVTAASGTANERRLEQSVTASTGGFTAGDKVSATIIYLGTGLIAGTMRMRLGLRQKDSAGGVLSNSFVVGTTTGTWTSLQVTNIAVVTDAGTGTIDYVLTIERETTGAETGTVFYDGGLFIRASALPTGWASGRSIANHFDDNGQAHINYLDAYNIPGDIPALLQIKAVEKEAHGNIWVGARQAGRMTSTLIFLEGESFTASAGANFAAVVVADASNGSVGTINLGSGTGLPTGSVYYWTRALSPPPVGAYRVLARARAEGPQGGGLGSTGTAYAGIGYVYGSITARPTATADMTNLGSGSLYAIHDVGQLTIPPLQLPTGGTLGTLTLHLGFMRGSGSLAFIYVDSLLLEPVNQGYVFSSKDSATDEVWADGRSQPQALYIMSTAGVVQSIPANQQGRPPDAHPQGNRYYFAVGTGTGTGTGSANVAWGWNVTLTYVPRFLQVM